MQEPPSFPFTLILLFSALNVSGATSNAQTPAVHGLSATNVSRSALARPSSRAVRLPTSRILRRSNFPAAVFAALSLADTLLQLMEIIPGTEGAGSIVQLNEATGPFQQKQLRQWIVVPGGPRHF
jgi:hypothetical protein